MRGERGLLLGEGEREGKWVVWSEDGMDRRRYSGGLRGSLRLDQEPPEEGEGESESRISSGMDWAALARGRATTSKY